MFEEKPTFFMTAITVHSPPFDTHSMRCPFLTGFFVHCLGNTMGLGTDYACVLGGTDTAGWPLRPPKERTASTAQSPRLRRGHNSIYRAFLPAYIRKAG